MIVITLLNQKGGVGKTTISVHLAHFWALRGMRVLLIDLDAQGHTAYSFGRIPGNGVFRLFGGDLEIPDVAEEVRPNLHWVSSDKNLNKIRGMYNSVNTKEKYFFLADKLGEVQGMYDIVVIDGAPGSDLIQMASIIASDYILIPTKMSLTDLTSVLNIIQSAQGVADLDSSIRSPQLLGIIPNEFDRTTSETKTNLEDIGNEIGREFILPPIPRDTLVREAARNGQTIWEYAPSSNAALGWVPNKKVGTNSVGRIGGYLHLGEQVSKLLNLQLGEVNYGGKPEQA
ncbi:MAG: ParA family protein [Anaerolineaceae bacterium]|jgi:chromosome partitioning protein|nr:ParA family protein [Anaerolineaceae bacterium]